MLSTAALVQKHRSVSRKVPREGESASQGSGRLCPSQLVMVALGLSQPHVPPAWAQQGMPCSNLLMMARTGLDRAPFLQGSITGPWFMGAGGMSCDQFGVGGRWTSDLGFGSIPMSPG